MVRAIALAEMKRPLLNQTKKQGVRQGVKKGIELTLPGKKELEANLSPATKRSKILASGSSCEMGYDPTFDPCGSLFP